MTLVRDNVSNQLRVCKKVSTASMAPHMHEMLKKEVQLLCILDHPHIVKLYEYAEDAVRHELVIILEYLPGGDCLGLLQRAVEPLDEAVVGRLVRQVLLALCYCHSHGVVHRDVKPENMMLVRDGLRDDLMDCKLIDFGFASHRDRRLTEVLGTPAYVAPEVLSEKGEYTDKSDMWSLGISTFELLVGETPFGKPIDYGGKPDRVFEQLAKYASFEDLRPKFQRSRQARDFITGLINRDPQSRPTAAEALEHPWLERHRAAHAHLTSDMMSSLARYTAAPPLVRCCLYVVATRMGIPHLEQFGAAFQSIDHDGDGRISSDELAEAISLAQYWWEPEIDADDVLAVADMDQTGALHFTEFVAICLYSQGGSVDDLIDASFCAFDEDRDGMVHVRDIRALFPNGEFPTLRKLPQSRGFDLEEWRTCFKSDRHLRKKAPRDRDGVRSLVDPLFRLIACTACATSEEGEYVVTSPSERLVVSPYSVTSTSKRSLLSASHISVS